MLNRFWKQILIVWAVIDALCGKGVFYCLEDDEFEEHPLNYKKSA